MAPIPPPNPVSRLAPTPNGELHWGNLLNFALTWASVRRGNGKLWLRFDDVDVDRCEPRFAHDAREILRYLGLDWDDEFSDQASHLADYRAFLERIPRYVCRCSRQEVFRRTGDYHYDGHCRTRGYSYEAGSSAVRFLGPKGPRHDFVLWRREDLPSYHLTSVRDDERMGIDLIVRGEDLRESTEVQRELSRALPTDPLRRVTILHHALLPGPDGQKLSKSRGDGELLQLIKRGAGPEELWAQLGTQVGVELRGPEDLSSKFPEFGRLFR
jgi:glutamyl/glutaminyl-tRNA synthetase